MNETLNTVLIGREQSLARFSELRRKLESGGTGHLWVTGDAGCGKSAFLRTCGQQAQACGWQVLQGQCTEETRANPYGPFLDMLGLCFDKSGKLINDRSVYSIVDQISLDDVFEAIDDIPGAKFVAFGIKVGRTIFESRRGQQSNDDLLNRNFEFILQVLQRIEQKRKKPLLLVIDDLHLASATTCSLIEYILTRSADTRLLVMADWQDPGRGDELARNPAQNLSAKIAHTLAQPGETLHLRPLSDDEMRQLIAQNYAHSLPESIVSTLIALSRGRPKILIGSLYLVGKDSADLAETGLEIETTHSALQTLIERQLSRLNDDQRAVLECAALLGPSIPLDVLIAAPLSNYLGLSERRLLRTVVEMADDGALLTWSQERVRFASSLMRQSLREYANPPLRRRDHLCIAQTLQAVASAARPAQLAEHYLLGGRPQKAVEFALQSADELLRSAAYPEAVESYRLALDALGQFAAQEDQNEMKYDILQAMSVAAEQAGDWDEALARLQDALTLSQDDMARQAEIYASMGWLRFQRSQVQAALEALNRSAELYTALDDVRGQAQVEYYLGVLYSQQKEWQRAASCFQRYLETSEQAGFSQGRASAYIELGNLYRLQYRWKQAEELLQRGIELAQTERDYVVLAQGNHYLGLCYSWQGKPKAVEMLHRALDIVHTRTKQPVQESRIQNTLAETLVRQNRWAEAEAAFQASARLKERLGDRAGLAITYGGLGRMYSRQWRFELAVEHLQKDIDLLTDEFEANVAWIQQWTNLIGEVRRLQGRHDRAAKRFADALALAQRIPDSNVQRQSLGFVHMFRANLALDRQDMHVAATELELAQTHLAGTWAEGQVQRTAARFARLDGDLPQARAHLDRALAAAQKGEDIDRAQTYLEQAHLHRAQGDHVKMRQAIAQVVELARQLQNIELERRAKALLEEHL